MRNTSKLSDAGHAGLNSFLASERVRAAFQMCRSVQDELKREDVEFKKGQLAELHAVVQHLEKDLKAKL